MLTIIIPVYNQLEHTKITCKSLIESTKDFDLVMVDDGSTDGHTTYFQELSEKLGTRFHPIHCTENQGVNEAWNTGLRYAMRNLKNNYICIANNDLHFTFDWDVNLIKALDSGYALVSPMSTEQSLPPDFPRGSTRHENPVHIEILGACFMFKKDLIDEIGYFPRQMRHYFGDNWIADFSKKKGHKIGHIQDSYIHHYFCITSSKLDNNHWFKVDGAAYDELCANPKKYGYDAKEVV
jgi:glycosyltransferase involved in cell wall biosynthesis